MRTRSLRRSLLLGAALTLVAVPAADAFYVKGKQTPTSRNGLRYEMTGGIVGKWKITSLHVKQVHGSLVKAKGSEKFNGCVDVARDGSCSGDPAGKLFFRFRFWAQFDQNGEAEELGTCAHRIVGSSGGLTGTTGFLMMVDPPASNPFGIRTHYEGDISPPGFAQRGAAPPAAC